MVQPEAPFAGDDESGVVEEANLILTGANESVDTDLGQASSLDDIQARNAKNLAEIERILFDAKNDLATPPRKVRDAADAAAEEKFHDPIANSKGDGGVSENGINIINSFINRTVFFDYFRHVAHKRFPDLDPAERVESLVRSDPTLYRRAMNSDHVLKLVTSYAIVLASCALIFKALFL